MRRPLLMALAVLAAGATACGHRGATLRSAPSTSAAASRAGDGLPSTAVGRFRPSVTLRLLRDHSDAPRYDVMVEVPLMAGLSDPAKQAKLNGIVEQRLEGVIATFKSQAQSLTVPAGVGPNDPATTSNLACHNDTRLLEPRLASFRAACVAYLAGAAHPNVSVLTFNFDLGAGEPINLGELFRPGAPYLSVLSDAAVAQLDARYHDHSDARSGAGPVAANFSAWTLAHGALEVTFAEDQVGPTSFGTPTVSFRYSDLAGYLRRPGLVDAPGPSRS